MSPKFVGDCDDCEREVTKHRYKDETENNSGISVWCSTCGGTVFARPEAIGRTNTNACPWFIPLTKQQREAKA